MEGLSVVDRCENCGREIGKLETAHVWENHVTCGACLGVCMDRRRSLPTATLLILSSLLVCGILVGVATTALVLWGRGSPAAPTTPPAQSPAKPTRQLAQDRATAIGQPTVGKLAPPTTASTGQTAPLELQNARARIAELETQLAAMQKQVARGSTTNLTTANATAPTISADLPAVPLTTLLAALPENLMPKDGETQRTAQQREDWLKLNLDGKIVTVEIEAGNFPVMSNGKWHAGGNLQNPPSWRTPQSSGAYYRSEVSIYCEFDTANATQAPSEGSGQERMGSSLDRTW